LLDLLGQGERSVDELAQEAGLTLANASAHLQVGMCRDTPNFEQ
jgi:DNA-binding transcriptional ArsR family regulator